ncbi:MAG: carbonic anhydrase family protein [Sulfuricurvum sp.]|nr:carbonic anhydrase family protein [Sulfuricurvum sp.]
MKTLFLALSIVSLLVADAYASEAKHEASHEVHWNYDAHGPAHWGEFGETCQAGKAQSPINIITKETRGIDQTDILTLRESVKTKASIADNGHAIQVNIDNGGKVNVDGVDYTLVQFHFHGLSEEQINGKHSDLVAHMVHKSAFGSLLVIAVLFDEGKTSHPMVQTVIGNVGKTVEINPATLLPKDIEHYYHFMGSLTTPPCSENVKWYVLKEVQSVSKEQVTALRKFYDHNYRPVQPLNTRVVESK